MENKLHSRLRELFLLIKRKAIKLKREIGALYLAYRRQDVPLYAKIVSLLVVGYALSPIDLIPDFIPVLGYLDDLVLLPIGIALAVKLIPSNIMAECREQAENIFSDGKPKSWIAGGIIISIWILIIIIIALKIYGG
ncbi:DUF1232 domain-containing protein [Clostridium sp. YIM B02515]|uniref:DUF1232 domain-containing protein n=1 Tax=Clostridium rhizosphaerae TaxID=2803861 RepID=A0ABS1TF36_9CLOT|nr:YkvA family protein [Clostridium rhizosphaerae]MBL4937692.1 DUF1232 domain-containing protein [Clostridium rhizosphaerae]